MSRGTTTLRTSPRPNAVASTGPDEPEVGPSPTATARQRSLLVGIVLVALVVRVAWAVWATREPVFLQSGDAYSYYFYGKQMAAGGGYLNMAGGGATAYYPVGYPAILGALFWLVQHTPIPDNLPLAGTLLNAVLGTASVALVFVVGRRAFGATVALVAAAITAVFPNLIFYTASLQIETAFIFLALVCLAIVGTHDWSTGPPSRNRLLLFGVVLSLSSQVRPFVLPFLVGMVLAVLLTGHGWRKAATTLAWVLLPLVVLAVPWTMRNLSAMDAPIVYSTNMGDTVCMDRVEGATGGFRWADHEGCVDHSLGEVERYEGNMRKAMEFVVEHPGTEVELIGRRAVAMMSSDHDGLNAVESTGPWLDDTLRSALVRIADGFFFVVLALGALGLPAFLRRHDPVRVIVGFALLVLLGLPLALWGSDRFHVPALPLLALPAAVTLVAGWQMVRDRGRRSTGGRRAAQDDTIAAAEPEHRDGIVGSGTRST